MSTVDGAAGTQVTRVPQAAPAGGVRRVVARPHGRGGSPTARAVAMAVVVLVALVLQTAAFPHLALSGVVPNLVLVTVVAAGVARGSHFAMVLGFAGGLLLDLAPPADHVAGRWALALLVVGWVAGRALPQLGPGRVGGARGIRLTTLAALAAVAACSFLGSSLYALTGLVLDDPAVSVPDLLTVVVGGVGYDLVAALVVVPLVLRLLDRLDPS